MLAVVSATNVSVFSRFLNYSTQKPIMKWLIDNRHEMYTQFGRDNCPNTFDTTTNLNQHMNNTSLLDKLYKIYKKKFSM